MGFKSWETPPEFFAALNAEFSFTLDAAASHENALCETYCTIDGSYNGYDVWGVEKPKKLNSLDGLEAPWDGERVFCNPPYDSTLYQWVEKAAKREAKVAVLLLPPSVDTNWYQLLLDQFYDRTFNSLHRWGNLKRWRGHRNSDDSFELLTYEGRLKFWSDGKPGSTPRAGNLLAIFRR